jgi:hypothetical protein
LAVRPARQPRLDNPQLDIEPLIMHQSLETMLL